MQTSSFTKNLWRYLPLLIVMVVAIAGSWVINDLRSESNDTPQGTNTQLRFESQGNCISPLIYTSLPPKCRTADGSFVEITELPSNPSIIPEHRK